MIACLYVYSIPPYLRILLHVIIYLMFFLCVVVLTEGGRLERRQGGGFRYIERMKRDRGRSLTHYTFQTKLCLGN